jgi:hypothetical protein
MRRQHAVPLPWPRACVLLLANDLPVPDNTGVDNTLQQHRHVLATIAMPWDC